MWCHLRVMAGNQATPIYALSFNRRLGRFIGEFLFGFFHIKKKLLLLLLLFSILPVDCVVVYDSRCMGFAVWDCC